MAETAIDPAAGRQQVKAVRALLAGKADPNIQDNAGRTALMLAADRGNRTIVDLLLEYGADMNIKDNAGCVGNTAYQKPEKSHSR